MKNRNFGNTDIATAPLGFGSMRLPMVNIGGQDYVDMDLAVEVIRHGFENGINYIDNGFIYCESESEFAVGRALRGWRDKITVTTKATKFRMANPGDLRRMLEHQLFKLDTDYVDFYCFHGVGWDNFHEIEEKTGWIKDMTTARDEGLVKHIGFSFHDEPENMIKLIDLGLFEMVTCQYNYLDQKNAESMAYAKEKGLAVVVMGPVGGGRLAGLPGFLSDSGELDTSSASGLALRFVLSNPNVSVAISGMNSAQMIDENIAAVERGPLSEAESSILGQLLEKTGKLADLYCTGCGYCMPCEHGVNIPARFEAMNYFKVYGLEEYARGQYKGIRGREQNAEGEGICVECGECMEKCPQNIEIIQQLKETEAALV
ncbi:aldo/keto reductase [Candidatus Poribacteria bacterium]